MDAELLPMVAFQRHPASIGRPMEPGAVSAKGFDGIVTWVPHMLRGDEDVPTRDIEAAVAADPARQDPPPGSRPPLPVPPPTVVSPKRLPSQDPFAILNSAPPQDPARAWQESSPLRRRSVPVGPSSVSLWDGFAAPGQEVRRMRWPALPRLVMGLGVVAVSAGLALAAVRYGPALLEPSGAVTAVFNAPMMVVRSAAAGRVVTVAATAAQLVDPRSPLLTLHTDQDSQDRAILAGVHGMIRSVETVPGAALVAGAPLVRLQDCDRAFLTIPSGAKLQAGQTVRVTLPDQTPVAGRVRPSAGVMEPPDSLVIGLEPGAMTASCPVGRAATVIPAAG